MAFIFGHFNFYIPTCISREADIVPILFTAGNESQALQICDHAIVNCMTLGFYVEKCHPIYFQLLRSTVSDYRERGQVSSQDVAVIEISIICQAPVLPM